MRRVVFDMLSICGSGYLLTSITLSRKRVVVWMIDLYSSQSKRALLPSMPSPLTSTPRLIEPRLHESKACSGCSPHGFVASIRPTFLIGLRSLMRSMNTTPGSPVRQACSTIRFQISPTVQYSAVSLPSASFFLSFDHCFVRGFCTLWIVSGLVRSSLMKRFVTVTEML